MDRGRVKAKCRHNTKKQTVFQNKQKILILPGCLYAVPGTLSRSFRLSLIGRRSQLCAFPVASGLIPVLVLCASLVSVLCFASSFWAGTGMSGGRCRGCRGPWSRVHWTILIITKAIGKPLRKGVASNNVVVLAGHRLASLVEVTAQPPTKS